MIGSAFRRGAAGVACALSLTACSGEQKSPVATIRLATTTSARDTGLLDVLLPAFRGETGIEVQAIAVGTGEALKYGERGDADVVLVHARKAEDAFLASGFGVERRDAWWNRFLVVGPNQDFGWDMWWAANRSRFVLDAIRDKLPFEVKPPAKGVLALIREKRWGFVSRGDDSGTHKREMELWGKDFQKWPGYVETGQGMSPTLTVADEKNAYTLTDEGTFLKLRKRLRLTVIVKDDPALVNPYGVILVSPSRSPKGPHDAAKKLFEWLTGYRCRALVQEFRVDGERAFFLPGEKPD